MKYANTEATKNYNAKYISAHWASVAQNAIIDNGDVCLQDLMDEFGITEGQAQKAKDDAVAQMKLELAIESIWNCPALADVAR